LSLTDLSVTALAGQGPFEPPSAGYAGDTPTKRGKAAVRDRLSIVALTAVVLLAMDCGDTKKDSQKAAEPNLITFSRIDRAWEFCRGKGTRVAILDWQFDLRGKKATKYIRPTSMVPGEGVGKLKPWHGEWMAEIVHLVAPDAKIIPIKARGLRSDEYEEYLIRGIRFAADEGAAAVTSSMGPLSHSESLMSAIDYAEARGTIFVNVHPEYLVGEDQKRRLCDVGECNAKIIHTGIVSVPDHPTSPEPNRDIYVWPYDPDAKYEDGWGYSNGPPTVAGVIALMRSANPNLTPQDTRRIIVNTAFTWEGFKVLDAEAAVKAALEGE
jgi:subtilisin family serine protease